MTPQLQQAIKLLQFSNLELAAYIEGELEKNPLLERDESVDGAIAEPGIEGAADRQLDEVSESRADRLEADSLDRLAQSDSGDPFGERPLDTDYENLYNHDSLNDSPAAELTGGFSSSVIPGRGGGAEGSEDYEQSIRHDLTLRQHLTQQLSIVLRDPADRVIGLHLIDQLDDAGYLRGDLAALAESLGCPVERIESTLALLHGFEPTGVFARTLSECLALQLAERNRLDPAMRRLLENLDLLAKADFSALQRLCGVDREDLVDMLAEIRALNPKPGLDFVEEPTHPLVPDVLLRALPNGKWLVELNSETLPRVLVNQSYYSEVSSRARDKKEREYLSDHLSQANWLVRALHQRATTILRVSRELVRQQDAFFRQGIDHLRPLTLKDIAQRVDLHESTVSRVTSNKYIATPRGTFELKYFFTAAIGGSDGAIYSAEAIRHRIKALIEKEARNEILSDDTIVEILRKDGVEIARRTVAKYRESMRIPSSVRRRRDKAEAS